MSTGRRLVVLRHGETEFNAAGRWQGQFDAPLSERGHVQAAEAARMLASYSPKCVVASDLSRAADTGRAVAEAAGIPITYDARLREVNVGDWAGLTNAQIREQSGDLLERIDAGEDLRRGGTGETLDEVARRVHAAALEVAERMAPDTTTVIATHGVAGRALVAALTGIAQHTAWLGVGNLGNCHWAVVEDGSRGWRMTGWNLPV
ncbi:histidine phosphatase family protein [Rudaeicoccus suwonensis]|uniref:Putative phosphoglycerate mutase n=1 Tax=Rudaeicoccus suwonensis TaxID=657409 RepID=A0A561E9L8_9MICO|nr:histidine phosphatase family protein [Rudaeicoccus suwonensis]TWE12314.1 putative phosphoglycerate mutase [Rudaeicoccus suwonensis]